MARRRQEAGRARDRPNSERAATKPRSTFQADGSMTYEFDASFRRPASNINDLAPFGRRPRRPWAAHGWQPYERCFTLTVTPRRPHRVAAGAGVEADGDPEGVVRGSDMRLLVPAAGK